MNAYRLLIAFGWLALLTTLGASQEGSVVIQVNCPDPVGCFRLLGQAIESAQEGATIQLGSGVFYELPIVINKTLTIRGTRDSSEPEVVVTVIKPFGIVQLFTIRFSDHPLSVILQDLIIESSGRGFSIEGPSEGVPEQLAVVLRDSGLYTGDTSFNVYGKARLTLQSNEIRSDPVFMHAEGIELFVYDNKIISIGESGYSGFPVMALRDVEARFERNRISGIEALSKMMLGIQALGGHYSFIENKIDGHMVGVALGGELSADFQRNVFEDNTQGIALLLPPCGQGEPAPELRFDGTITGSDNQFLYNSTSDLCPALNEFPWPEGFTTP